MSRIIFDAEGNGLLEDVTEIWCICTLDPDTGVRHSFVHPSYVHTVQCSGDIATGLQYISQYDEQIAHNGLGYDWPAFEKVLGYQYEGLKTDSLILSKLAHFDIRIPPGCKDGPHSVEAWGIRFGRHKPSHEDWSQFSPEMLHRCQEDTEIQFMLWAYSLTEMAKDGEWGFAVWLETEFAKIIQKQNQRGWNFNTELAMQYSKQLEDEMSRLHAQVAPYLPLLVKDEKELKKPLTVKGVWAKAARDWVHKIFPGYTWKQDGIDYMDTICDHQGIIRYKWSIGGPFCRVAFEPLNLGSPNQLKAWLPAIGWRPTEWNIDKKTHKPKSPKLTEDSYDSLTIGIGPQIAQWLKCKHRKSTIDGWIDKVRIDGTLMCPSNALGTPTGRQTHKVVVNIPNPDSGAYFAKEMRQLFTARPGYVIVGGDSASCQVRALCHYMPDEKFIEAVLHGKKEEGTDIHSLNMNLTGIVHRSKAKNFFYGFLFGAQAAKVGSIIGKGKREGQKLLDQYFANMPLLKQLIDNITEEWKEKGYVIGIDGRVVRVRKKHEILCYMLQLLEAVSMKLAAVLVDQWARVEGLDFHMTIHYHDEAQYEVRPEHAERFKELFYRAIVYAGEVMQLNIPLDGEVLIGNSWGDCH